MYPAQKIFDSSIIGLVTIFFILMVAIIIITAVLYHNRKRSHQIDLANFQNILLQAQLEVQEQTMQTIGADLHDNIGQLLSLTSLTLNSVELEESHKAYPKIDAAIGLTAKSIQEMRLLGKLLQGDQLVRLGLSEAIRYQIDWLERSGRYEISYDEESEIPSEKNSNIDLILFRILQEILNNVIKHARATCIGVKLAYCEGKLQLQIIDNGVGFDAGNLPAGNAGMGLHNIQKRAAIVGGEISIDSKPGVGTRIALVVPYP